MVLLCISYAGLSFAGSAIWCLPGDIAPQNMTSVLGGMQNCIANFGGILGPIVTGFIISSTGSFIPAFGGIGSALCSGGFDVFVCIKGY